MRPYMAFKIRVQGHKKTVPDIAMRKRNPLLGITSYKIYNVTLWEILFCAFVYYE